MRENAHRSKTVSGGSDGGGVFEAHGMELILNGASGPAKLGSRKAQGKGVHHDSVVAEKFFAATGSSGPSKLALRIAAGSPSNHQPTHEKVSSHLTGSGKLSGAPIRRA